MLSVFFDFLRVAYIAGEIAARHTRQLQFYASSPPPASYRHPLEQTLVDALTDAPSGVFVHWGVYESGKSTAVRAAAWRLQTEAGRQAIVVHGFDMSQERQASAWLRRAIGIPENTHEPLSRLLLQRKSGATLIIDHADLLLRDDAQSRDARGALAMVRALIAESAATRKFNALLVVNSWERAKELVDAGCTLLPGDAPARWTRAQLEALWATLPAPVQEAAAGGDAPTRDRLLRFATLSGTPGYLTFEAHGGRLGSRYAAIADLEWRMGAHALYGAVQAAALPPSMELVGRFPDRNGRYHHGHVAALAEIKNES